MPTESIILFDGLCNLCSASVDFVLRRDPRAHFRFASLQSDLGQRLLTTHGVSNELGSVVLIEDGQAYDRSTAALRIARRLRFPWPIFYALILIPRPLRDLVYGWIAGNRYRWFGRRETCRLPSPEFAGRFLT